MAIDWKTIISEFDGKPTLLQAIGKLRKAVEDETITIQQAQAEIAKLESQQKADEALIKTAQSTADEAKINAYNASQKGDQALGKATTADTKAQAADTKAQAADTKAQQALDLATTNETDIGTLDGQVAQIETNLNNKQDKITNQTELTARSLTTVKDIICENNLKGRYLFCSHTNMGSPSNSPFLIFEYGQSGIVKSTMRFQTFANMNKNIVVNFPNEDGTVVYTKNLKTLFGNQSIVGEGNIDLYRHDIAITFLSADSNDIHVEFISSKNTVCDSLQDLKTVLGDSFRISANGAVFGIFDELSTEFVAEYMRETGIQTFYKETGSDFGAKFISFADNPFSLSDTVTTI